MLSENTIRTYYSHGFGGLSDAYDSHNNIHVKFNTQYWI